MKSGGIYHCRGPTTLHLCEALLPGTHAAYRPAPESRRVRALSQESTEAKTVVCHKLESGDCSGFTSEPGGHTHDYQSPPLRGRVVLGGRDTLDPIRLQSSCLFRSRLPSLVGCKREEAHVKDQKRHKSVFNQFSSTAVLEVVFLPLSLLSLTLSLSLLAMCVLHASKSRPCRIIHIAPPPLIPSGCREGMC